MMSYTNRQVESAKAVIRYYNEFTGTHRRFGDESDPTSSLSLCLEVLKENCWDEDLVKEYLRNNYGGRNNGLKKCLKSLLGGKATIQETEEEPEEQAEEKPEEKPVEKPAKEAMKHEKLDTVLKFVQADEPVYLVGPAGSGKNVLCKQVAEAMDLDFYFTNAVTQEYKLTGFVDAMGNYQPTQFFQAFTKGGLFMLDEMDASIPEVLVILNAAIANRYFDFPGIGYVEAHRDFRIIAAGNTIGQGADYQYTGRNCLDMASLDRFAVVKVDYDRRVEIAVAGEEELAHFCRDFRDAATANGSNVVVSYRAIGRLAKMLKVMDAEEALETCLVKGMDKDDLHMIVTRMTCSNKYMDAMMSLLKRM